MRQDERSRPAHADGAELSRHPGDVLVRREVLNDGRCWLEGAVIVVQDAPDLLVTYTPTGAPFRFPPGDWPTANGRHPWDGKKERWQGHGALALNRPGDSYSVLVFWSGRKRDFSGWYVNLEEPLRRTRQGYDTQDLELDIWLPREGGYQLKDDHVMEERVAEGRFTEDQVAATRAEAARLLEELERHGRWWSDDWSTWQPDPAWPTPEFPE